ncbi:MAG: methyltransferase domain-containing protein [Ignavibacteriales bacterium]
MRLLNDLIGKGSEHPVRILDVGGTLNFWESLGFPGLHGSSITLLNLEKQNKNAKIECIVGNGCEMSYLRNLSFDVVFSNSVIEHAGSFTEQKKMAKEIVRVGRAFFIQTPNFYFPLEPHVLFFGFQWLPLRVRAFLVRHFSLGWYEKFANYEESVKFVKSIRLLTKNELKILFPGASIYHERFLGITKSFVIYKGF